MEMLGTDTIRQLLQTLPSAQAAALSTGAGLKGQAVPPTRAFLGCPSGQVGVEVTGIQPV